MSTRNRATLAPVVKTRFAYRLTRGGAGVTKRRECWAAKTTDGVWDFEREDSPGTPWLVYHNPSVADQTYPLPVTLCGTLRQCRVLAASGALDEALARRIAEAEAAAIDRRCDPACLYPVLAHLKTCTINRLPETPELRNAS